ncbi:MAG: hypothetical protein ACFFCF_05030 [Promethearchaeota archaeon]
MTETTVSAQKLWIPSIIIFTLLMLVLFLLTIYFGFLLNLLWTLGLGLIYGISLAFSYYYDTYKKPSISLMYVVQAAVVFIIILVFVWVQGIYGPHPFGYDYLILAFSMLFAGGMFGIPVYQYTKIKRKSLVKEDDQ